MCDGSSHEPAIALAGIDLKSACGYAVLEEWHSTVPNPTSSVTSASRPSLRRHDWFFLDEDVGGQFALSAQVTGHAHGASYGGKAAAL
jgi:hypothetical protein